MDKKNIKVKCNFTQLIGQVSKLYKELNTDLQESYMLGKKEAYEEILNWFTSSHNTDFRYISATAFFNMIQEKITKTKSSLINRNGEEEEELKQTIGMNDIKISDNRKRLNRFSNSNYTEAGEYQMDEDNLTGQTTFPFSVNSLIAQSQTLSAGSQLTSFNTSAEGDTAGYLNFPQSSVLFPTSKKKKCNNP